MRAHLRLQVKSCYTKVLLLVRCVPAWLDPFRTEITIVRRENMGIVIDGLELVFVTLDMKVFIVRIALRRTSKRELCVTQKNFAQTIVMEQDPVILC